MLRLYTSCAVLSCALMVFGGASSAQAAGFYLQENSVSGQGAAFSGVTSSAKDASAVWFNPAALTQLKDRQMNVAVHILNPETRITDTGSTLDPDGPGGAPPNALNGGKSKNPYDLTPIPNFFVAVPLTEDKDFWIGGGVNAPFGLSSDYGDTWFGRFDSTSTDLKTYNFSTVAAYKLSDKLSIGGGIDVQYAEAELKRGVYSPVAGNGTSLLAGDDISYGFNIGFVASPVETLDVGMHFRSGMSHKLDGQIKLSGLTAGNFNVAGNADLNLPDITSLGATYHVSDDWRVMGNMTWFAWSRYERISPIRADGVATPAVEQQYQDTLAFAIGTEYDLNRDWTLRAGVQYDPTPTKDGFRTSRTPDGDRTWLATGATWQMNDNMTLDLAATYIHISSERLDLTRNSGLAVIDADIEADVGILSMGVNYSF